MPRMVRVLGVDTPENVSIFLGIDGDFDGVVIGALILPGAKGRKGFDDSSAFIYSPIELLSLR